MNKEQASNVLTVVAGVALYVGVMALIVDLAYMLFVKDQIAYFIVVVCAAIIGHAIILDVILGMPAPQDAKKPPEFKTPKSPAPPNVETSDKVPVDAYIISPTRGDGGHAE